MTTRSRTVGMPSGLTVSPGCARLGDVHPPQRLGPVRLGPQLSGEPFEEPAHPGCPVGFDGGDGHAVDAGGARLVATSTHALHITSLRASLS